MTRIKITWEPSYHPAGGYNGESASLEIHGLLKGSDEEICEAIYAATNLYQGNIWNAMVSVGLPENRTHTALSCHLGEMVDGELKEYGDKITIDDRTYEVAGIGWRRV